MARGIPDIPSEDLTFVESVDDETCPTCGWETEIALRDTFHAHQTGALLAIEPAERSPFTSMAGAQLLAHYWRCPAVRPDHVDSEDHQLVTVRCNTLFTTEEEDSTAGAMS